MSDPLWNETILKYQNHLQRNFVVSHYQHVQIFTEFKIDETICAYKRNKQESLIQKRLRIKKYGKLLFSVKNPL